MPLLLLLLLVVVYVAVGNSIDSRWRKVSLRQYRGNVGMAFHLAGAEVYMYISRISYEAESVQQDLL